MVGAQSASRLITAIYSLLYYYGLCQALGQCGRAKKASEQRKKAHPFSLALKRLSALFSRSILPTWGLEQPTILCP